MEEASRFLRYVIPGLALIIEFILYLWISSPEKLKSSIVPYFTGNNLGSAFVLFIGSGGIGYLIANIYHRIIELSFLRSMKVNHKPLIIDAVRRKLLCIRRSNDDSEVLPESLNHNGAWSLTTSLWHERVEEKLSRA